MDIRLDPTNRTKLTVKLIQNTIRLFHLHNQQLSTITSEHGTVKRVHLKHQNSYVHGDRETNETNQVFHQKTQTWESVKKPDKKSQQTRRPRWVFEKLETQKQRFGWREFRSEEGVRTQIKK